MEALGIMLFILLIWIWTWPESFGRWLANVRAGYARAILSTEEQKK